MTLANPTNNPPLEITAVTVKAEHLNIKETTIPCKLADNNWARLMYYLNCVKQVISLEIPSQITKFDQYENLSFDDKNYILMLAEVLSPSLFVENHIFVKDAILNDKFSNNFYDVSYTKLAAAATKEFFVAGMRVTSLKMMAYEEKWKKMVYDDPMAEFQERLNDIHYGRAEKYRAKDKSTKENKSVACLLI